MLEGADYHIWVQWVGDIQQLEVEGTAGPRKVELPHQVWEGPVSMDEVEVVGGGGQPSINLP